MDYGFMTGMLREMTKLSRGHDPMLTYLVEMATIHCESLAAAAPQSTDDVSDSSRPPRRWGDKKARRSGRRRA